MDSAVNVFVRDSVTAVRGFHDQEPRNVRRHSLPAQLVVPDVALGHAQHVSKLLLGHAHTQADLLQEVRLVWLQLFLHSLLSLSRCIFC